MKTHLELSERITLSPKEFASLFGRDQTWAYRLIYSKKIKALNNFGRTMIPRTEIDKILSEAEYTVDMKRSELKKKKK